VHPSRVINGEDLDRLCPLPPAPDTLPRVISRDDAYARGITRSAISHLVRRGRWRRVLPRTYLTAETLTEHDRFEAALIFAGTGAALSGAAALRASGVRRVTAPTKLLVLVPPDNHTASTGWVRIRPSARPMLIQLAPGPRRVEIARAAADLAVELRRLDDVRTLVARVVQDRHCTLAELAVELECGPRRGSANLRKALEEVGWGSASAPEARAARILRRGGITGFVQNAELRLPDGTTRRIDFYWPALRACLEIDSVEWHFDQPAWTSTLDRHLDLTKFGLSVVHRPPSALDDELQFLRDVRAWLAARAAELGINAS
jgi:hypothetical protein